MADAASQRSHRADRIERPRFCSQCGNPVVVADASFCKNCGAPLSATVWLSHDVPWRPKVAVLLSIIPGLGHWYKGEPGRGFLWFISVVVFLLLDAWPMGGLLWLICACNAGVAGAIREDAIANATRLRWRAQRKRWHRGSGPPMPLRIQQTEELKESGHRAP
jgi:zinc-ribbon domain